MRYIFYIAGVNADLKISEESSEQNSQEDSTSTVTIAPEKDLTKCTNLNPVLDSHDGNSVEFAKKGIT